MDTSPVINLDITVIEKVKKIGRKKINLVYFRFAYYYFIALKSRAREFTQYRSPVGLGPSSNTCPR